MAKSDTAVSKGKTWFEGLKAEFGKIVWPTRQDVVRETTAVVVVSVLLGVVIAVLDFLIQHGVNLLENLQF